MNSVPNPHGLVSQWHKDGPFSISQVYYGDRDAIVNYPSTIGSEGAYRGQSAIFRVYPKGQNPMSVLREQEKQWEKVVLSI